MVVVIAVVVVGGYFALVPTGASSTSHSSSATTESYTVKIANSTTLGPYLVNATGFTLYYFEPDIVGNTTSPPVSKCTQSCTTLWPPFYASTISVPPGLNSSSFSSFTRSDGTMQSTYMGHPLYTYLEDTAPGQTKGQGVNEYGGLWYVVSV